VQRDSTLFFGSLVVGVLLLYLMFLDAAFSRNIDRGSVRERREIVKVLGLTDLCLFTEARYTRHPSMADRYSPFQDHPFSFEHFPTGSIIGAPLHLTSRTLHKP
jgi:hypothetical protein